MTKVNFVSNEAFRYASQPYIVSCSDAGTTGVSHPRMRPATCRSCASQATYAIGNGLLWQFTKQLFSS